MFDAVVKNGKTTLKCSFTMVFNGAKVDTKKSKAKCTGAKKTEKVNNARVKSASGAEYSISMTVAKSGKVKLSKVLVTKGILYEVLFSFTLCFCSCRESRTRIWWSRRTIRTRFRWTWRTSW